MSQPLWNNVFIKIENKSVFYKSWYIKNLCYVNDLVDESGVFMLPTELINEFTIYYSIPFVCTSASKLRSFQYKIFNRTIGTNVLLMKMGIKDHDD